MTDRRCEADLAVLIAIALTPFLFPMLCLPQKDSPPRLLEQDTLNRPGNRRSRGDSNFLIDLNPYWFPRPVGARHNPFLLTTGGWSLDKIAAPIVQPWVEGRRSGMVSSVRGASAARLTRQVEIPENRRYRHHLSRVPACRPIIFETLETLITAKSVT